MRPKVADGMTNSVDPDQSDLSLHCLLFKKVVIFSDDMNKKIETIARGFEIWTLKACNLSVRNQSAHYLLLLFQLTLCVFR